MRAGWRYGQYLANIDLSREYDMGFAKPLTVAFGVEYRAENFKIRPGDIQSYAVGPLLRASIASTAELRRASGRVQRRDRHCTFPAAPLRRGAGFPRAFRTSSHDRCKRGTAMPPMSNSTPTLSTGLTTTVAGRYEHYSDFGDTLTGKFAARYRIAPGFALRGSVSNGFRAPSLHQQYFTTTSTNFIAGVPIDILTVAVSPARSHAAGIEGSKPEKSFNLLGGFTAQPMSGLTLTVDYYNIKINDRIVLTENLGARRGNRWSRSARLCSARGDAATAARFFINGLDTRTQGRRRGAQLARCPVTGFGKMDADRRL